MVETTVSVNQLAAHYRIGSPSAIFGLLLLPMAVCLSLLQTAPPRAAASDAALADFSSGRAMRHVRAIGQKARPVGAPEHDHARDYIIGELQALGVNPEVQAATAQSKRRGFPIVFGSVENVFARAPGRDNSKVVMLLAHYDSVPTSPGASDNGVGVAVLLETLRAIRTAAPLKNDLLFLFSDAEEVGLLGAGAFVDENPAARDIGLVLNFEARGNSGPAMLFETGSDNGWFVKEFAEAAPYPVANSISNEIYKLLPNDTDLSVFKRAGTPGLNFAYIGGLNHYHTSLDNADTVDERSVQHHGTYALAIARHFGNLDLNQRREPDRVYFDILGLWLIQYPVRTSTIISILVVMLFALTVVIGWRSGKFKFAAIASGAFGWLLSAAASVAGVMLAWWLITLTHSHYKSIFQEDAYNGYLYLIAFACLTIAINSTVYGWLRNRISPPNLIVGWLIWWAVLVIATSLYLPGASYLFTWPLVFCLVALGSFVLSKHERVTAGKPLLIFSICAIPGIILLTPMLYMIFLAMSFNVSAALVVLITLQLALIVPHIDLLAGYRKWLLPLSSLAAAIGFIIIGSFASKINSSQRQPYSLFYVMNADTGNAVWASFDAQPNEWTSQFFSGTVEKGSLGEYMTSNYKSFMNTKAPVIAAPAPTVSILEDVTRNDIRSLHLRVISPRQAQVLTITADPGDRIVRSVINRKVLINKPGARWFVRYYAAPKDGIDLILEVKSPGQVKLRISDLSYGLPEIASASFTPKPDRIMPSVLEYSDTLIVTKSFSF